MSTSSREYSRRAPAPACAIPKPRSKAWAFNCWLSIGTRNGKTETASAQILAQCARAQAFGAAPRAAQGAGAGVFVAAGDRGRRPPQYVGRSLEPPGRRRGFGNDVKAQSPGAR